MSGTTAPAPSGMQRIPLVTEHFPHSSTPLSLKQLINLFAEQPPKDARSPVALLSTPGLNTQMTVGSGPIRAMNGDLPGLIYLVSGGEFYRLQYDNTPGSPHLTDLGSIGTPGPGLPWSSQTVSIAVGVSTVVVCVPPNAFTCAHTDTSLVQLSGTFPGNASSVAYLDGYYVFTSLADLSMFFICGLMDPTNFDSLDFAHADASPNVVVRVLAYRGDLWFMGQAAVEIWYDSGDQDFPFRRRPGGVIPHSCGGAPSPATGDGSVFWVGVDSIVYRSSGYQAQRISTHGIEAQLRALGGRGIAPIGLTYSQNGHVFYAITAGQTTWVYDCATQLWHTRSSSLDGSQPWRVMSASNVDDSPLFGDSLSGKLFYGDLDHGTEDGVDVIRWATLPPLYATTRRAFCARLEVEMATGGQTQTVTLSWSDDGGHTFTGGPRQISAGTQGAYRTRAFTTRLGSFRERMFRLTTTSRATYYAVDADIAAGNN